MDPMFFSRDQPPTPKGAPFYIALIRTYRVVSTSLAADIEALD